MNRNPDILTLTLISISAAGITTAGSCSALTLPDDPPTGFTAIFNGQTLEGWHGLVGNPISRSEMSPDKLTVAYAISDAEIAKHWRAENGEIVNDGHGPHLCTDKKYRDLELYLDWKITAGADSGIYLRGTPQVQIWDPINGIDQAKVGSGGLYNNQKNQSKPITLADYPASEWNTYFIRMIGERVTVKLNGQLVVDDIPMENYWDRARPIFAKEQIELQTHGGEIRFRNLFIREISTKEVNKALHAKNDAGFHSIFNDNDLTGWTGSVNGYYVEDGAIVCDPNKGGNLFTEKEYDNFILRFEFKLPPGGNNGLAIRAPLQGNPAYQGMELQVLDNSAEKYANLQKYQYHGSIYGIVPAHRGYQRAVGEWNFQEVECNGTKIKVTLNGTVIVDADLSKIEKPTDGNDHPGIKRTTGHIGFMGHGDKVQFRKIRIKELD